MSTGLPLAAEVVLPWDGDCPDPVAALGAARERHGDTFYVDSGGDHYLFVFSAPGVEWFYSLPEEQASKGLADFRMLRRKLPDEMFIGRRMLPSELFRRGDVTLLLAALERAVEDAAGQLGSAGTTDLFDLSRLIGHRMGLAAWGGPGATSERAFSELVAAFDALDGSAAFVHPDAMAAVARSGKQAERAALETITQIVGRSVPPVGTELPDDAAGLFVRIVGRWAGEPEPARSVGIAGDVALIHVASMSNMVSALGWMLVDLLGHPDAAARVADGELAWAQNCALESIRLAQRSIMSRYVVAPLELPADLGGEQVAPGTTVATLLPLLNSSAAPGLSHWDPERWDRHRLKDASALASPQLVTAFGHGRHSCPAQPFSLAAMSAAATRLLARYELTPQWQVPPGALAVQLGGVARPAGPAVVGYRTSALRAT